MAAYVVVKWGGHQFKLEPDEQFEVDRLAKPVGEKIVMKEVLLSHDSQKVTVGTPTVGGASVVCEVVDHHRGEKRISFKFKRHKNYHRKIGYRPELTTLKVSEIKL